MNLKFLYLGIEKKISTDPNDFRHGSKCSINPFLGKGSIWKKWIIISNNANTTKFDLWDPNCILCKKKTFTFVSENVNVYIFSKWNFPLGYKAYHQAQCPWF